MNIFKLKQESVINQYENYGKKIGDKINGKLYAIYTVSLNKYPGIMKMVITVLNALGCLWIHLTL